MENVNVSTLVTSPLPAATASRRKQAKPQPQRIEEDVNASSPSISDEAVSQEEIQAKQEIPSFFGAPLEAGDVAACTAPQTERSLLPDAVHHTKTTADEGESEGDGEDDNRPTRADKNDTNNSATVTSNITHRALLQQPPSVADLQGLSMEALRSKITELCSAMQLSYSVYNDLTHLLGNGGGGVSGTVRSTTTKADLSTQKVSAGEQSDETENQNRDESHEKQTVNDCSASEASAEKIQHHHGTSSSNELISPRMNSDDRAGLSETGEENGVPSDNGYRHRCPYCTKAFPGLSALTIHVRSHTGEKPYQCNYCLHRFTTKGNLKVHVQRHVEKGDQPLSPARFDSNFFPGSSATDHNNRCCSESPPPSSSGAPPPPPPSQAEAQQQVVAPLLLSNVVTTNTHTSSSLLTVPHFATPHSKILPPQLSLVPPSPHNWPVVPTSLLTPASTITTSTNTFMSAPTSSSYPLSASFLPSPISPAFSAAAAATAAASSSVLPPPVLAALFNSHFNSALAQQQAASGVSSSQTTLAAVATGAMAQPNVAAPLPFANNIPTPFSPQILSSFMWAAAAAAAQRNQVAAATHGHALATTMPSTAAPTLTSCPTLQRSRPSSSASIDSARTHHTTANDNKPSASAAVVVPPALPFSMFQSLPHSGGSNSFRPSIMFSPTTMHRRPSTSSSSSIMSPFPNSSFPFGTCGNGILPFPLLRPSATSTSNFTPSSLPSTTLPLPFSGPNFGAFARPLVPPMFNMFAPPQSTNSNDSLSSNINNINTNGSGKRYDPLLDPIVFTALLPQPGSNDNAWEQLMVVDDSPESTRLLTLMDTMLDKLSDPNQCIVCKRILSCKSALVMHYRTHTGERPFRCRLCSRAFTTKGNLKTHMGVHRVKLPLRPFIECPVCVRPFNDISILQQHIRAHAHMGQLGVPPPGQSSSSVPGDDEDETCLDEQEDELVQPQRHQPTVELGANDADIDCIKSSSRTEEPALAAEDGDAGDKPKKPESPPHIFNDENGSTAQLNRAVTIVDVSNTRSHSNPLDKAEEDQSMHDEHVRRKRHLSSDDDVAIDERHKRSRSESGAYAHSVQDKEQAVDGMQPKVQEETEEEASVGKPASNVDDPSTAALDTTKEAGNEPDNIKTEAECGTNTVTCEAENKSATSAFAGIEDLIKRTTAELGRSPLVASLMPFGFSLPHSTASVLLNIPTSSAGVNATPSQSSAFDRPNLRPNYTCSLPAGATAAHWPVPALRLPPPQQLGSFSTHNGENVYRHHSTNNSNNHQTPMITPELAALMQQKARNTTCNICFKTFACQSALQIHYRSHTKERPFKCPICSRGFTTKGNMKQHLLTHKIRDMPTNNHQHHQQNSTTSSSASPIPLSTSACTRHTTKDGGNGSEMPRNPFNNFPTFYANEMQHRLATVMRQQQQMSNPFMSPFQHLRANGFRSGEQRERSQSGSMRQPTLTEDDDDVEIEVVDQQLHVEEDENVSSRPVSLPSKATSCNNVIQQRVGTTSVSPALDEAAAAQDNTGSPPDGEHRARARSSTRPQTRYQQEQHQRTSRSELEKPRTCASSPFETTCVHGVQASEGSQYRLLVVCRKCDKSFGSNSALDVHMQTTHASKRPFMCPHKDCERAFTTKGNLKVHLASHDSLPHQTSNYQGFPQSAPHSVPRRQPLKPSTFLPPSLLTTSVFTATEAAGDCRMNSAGENGKDGPQSFSTAGGANNSPLNEALFAQNPPVNGPNNVSTLTNPMFSAAARAALFSTARNGVVNCPLLFQLPTAATPANLATANASAAAAAIAAVQTRAVFSSFMANLTNNNMLMQYAQMLAQMNNSKLHHLSTGVPTNVSSSVSTSSPPPAPVEVDDDVKHTDANSMYRTSERITCGGGEDDQESDDVEVDD